MRKLIVTFVTALSLAIPTAASAHLIAPLKTGTPTSQLTAAKKNLAHARGACRAHTRAGSANSTRSHCKAIPWLQQVREDRFVAANPAWAWYLTPTVQCVVNHEGAWTSVNPAGYYGRFQMDIPFQNETPYGRAAFSRWGTANNWPPIVQVKHAHGVWTYAGWSRWPTYYAYCD